jgi:hypothetical protein
MLCEVCAGTWDVLFGFFCRQPRALTVKSTAREEWLGSFGFCPSHTWMLAKFSSPRSLSASYPTLMEDAASHLLAFVGKTGSQASENIQALLRRTSGCPACRLLAQADDQIVSRIRLELGQGGGPSKAPVFLCLRHLAKVLPGLDEDRTATLLRAYAETAAQVADDLRGYVSKFDTLRRGQISAEEQSAHQDALLLLVGGREVGWFPGNS